MREPRRRSPRGMEQAIDRARRFRWRIRILTGGFILLFSALALQAISLMAFSGDGRLKKLAERQHNQVVALYPKRGTLYDRNEVPLALSVDSDSVYADPKFVQDPSAAADALAPYLKLKREELLQRLQQSQRFVWLERRLGPNEALAIRKLKLKGIHTITENRRFYPNRELGGALLGFTNIDDVGIEGLERSLEGSLNGQVTKYVRLRDAKGRDIHPEGVLVQQNQDGGSVVLTIDRNIQYMAEQALNRYFTAFNAKNGFVIVMDPKSGEVLAAANAPGYNPNVYSQYAIGAFKNQSVVSTFEPGSTQKCFLLAAALNDKVIRTTDSFDCEGGAWKVGRNTINDTHEYGVLSLREVLKYSSNIGSAKIGDKLGKERLYDYYRAFGFGESTGVGLPGEISGILRKPTRWGKIGLYTHSFGQGMTVTGMQIASALSALANDGKRMKPYIVKERRDQNGNTVEKNQPVELAQVVSPEVSRTLREYMTSVTEEGGTGTKAAIDGYTVAGKTGTAQKVDPVLRRYAPGMYVSSFVGFVPAEDPRLVIVAVLDEPRGGQYYGGTVSGPIFAEIAAQAMRYLGVPPSPPKVAALSKPTLDAHGHVVPPKPPKAKPVDRITFPEGAVVLARSQDQDIPTLTPITQEEGEKVEAYVMPDFTGQTMRSVLAALDDKMLALNIQGSGVAVEQTPKPGETIRTGELVSLVFSQEVVPRKKAVKP
ncbi:MAG: penicillin-binding protein [Myxococcota bacterium]